MKLRYEFSVMEMDGEYMAVPVGENAVQFNGMLRMNDVSAEILDLLKEDTTPETVHRILRERYPDSDDREIGEQLAAFLNQLVREGLLIVP
ncbi:MAG: PqqD family protein [Oscillospiraceae bacterium]|nr:PqqD family protein [Oscillospiraceae bacterium]